MFNPLATNAGDRNPPDDYVEFVRAGTRVTGEFECTGCGDRLVTRRALPPCSRCGETLWERSTWTPFREFTDRLRVLVDTEGRSMD